MGELVSNIWGDKPWYKSLTSWGLIVFVGATSVLDEACVQGMMSSDVCDIAKGLLSNVGVVLTVLGIRKAANTPTPVA